MQHFEGDELSNILKDKSDFPHKYEKMSSMLFDLANCDLYDNARPINWVDPNSKVLFAYIIF